MNTTEQTILDDLQVRCLSYNLLRKYPIQCDPKDVEITAIKWSRQLGMPVEFGEAAFEAWKAYFV